MYCVMRASVPSLYNVYRRYDTSIKSFHEMKRDVEMVNQQKRGEQGRVYIET